MRKLDTVFVTGYSQAPKGTKLFQDGALIGVMLEVDRTTNRIVNAECTFITHAAQDYFKRMMNGFDFKNELDEIVQTVEANMFIPSTQSIIVAIKIAHQRYMDNYNKRHKQNL